MVYGITVVTVVVRYHTVMFPTLQDPVANVRLSVSQLLPNIKRSLKLPSDRLLVQLFDQTLRMLYSMENDTDVCYNVRHTLPELNRIEIAVETVSEYIPVHSNVFVCLFLYVCACVCMCL